MLPVILFPAGRRTPPKRAAPVVALVVTAVALTLPLPPPAEASARHTVALLPFTAFDRNPTPFEKMATDLVATRLSADERVRLVEPDRLLLLAEESGMDLRSHLSDEDAVRLAGMSEADLLILSTTRKVSGKVAVVSRIVGVANRRVEEVFVSGSTVGRIRPLVLDLAEKIHAAIIKERSGILTGETGAGDRLADFTKSLSGRRLPLIFVDVRESYDGQQRQDPASGEELTRILEECGFHITPSKPDADVIIFGRAVGSVGKRREEFVTSTVDLELRAVAPSQGELLAVANTTRTAVDLFASLAGSKSFRDAATAIAPEFITTMVYSWEEGIFSP